MNLVYSYKVPSSQPCLLESLGFSLSYDEGMGSKKNKRNVIIGIKGNVKSQSVWLMNNVV